MSYSDNIFIFYRKSTNQIIFIQEPLITDLTPEKFFDERMSVEVSCKNASRDEFGVIVSDRYRFNQAIKNTNLYFFRIDTEKNDIEYVLKRQVVSNPTYNNQSVKRVFTDEEVLEMYVEDYINNTLKNLIKSGCVVAKFLPLKDINVYVHALDKNWNYFHSDQFLTDSDIDKTQLGRDIYENGTYWPVVVSPLNGGDPDRLYCFEGTHRIVSLKLNQMMGIVPEDFKVLCLCYEENYEHVMCSQSNLPIEKRFKARSVIEVLYGNQVLTSDDAYNEAVDTCIKDHGSLINEYTIEWNTKTISDAVFAAQTYPHWLRDLIYPIRDVVKPSAILNNEELFWKWINE